MMKKHTPTVTYLLSDIKDEDLRGKLEHRFIEFEGLKKIGVEAQRAAFRAQTNAAKIDAEIKLSQLDFLTGAAEAFELISTEPMWMVRRRGDGQVVLECLLTEKDMQQMARAQTKQMKEQINEIAGHTDEGEDDDDDMFRK